MDSITPQAMHKLVFTILVHGLPDAQTGLAHDVLANALRSPNGQVRELAVVAISELAVSPAQRVALLKEAARDPYARVRRRAMRALGDFGPHALAALSQITSGLRDPDPSVRRDSAGTLGRLGPAAQPAVQNIVDLLIEADMRTRVVAATALKRIGEPAIPALMQGLQSLNPELRGRCAVILAHLVPDEEMTVTDVRKRMRDSLVQTPMPMATPSPVPEDEFELSIG